MANRRAKTLKTQSDSPGRRRDSLRRDEHRPYTSAVSSARALPRGRQATSSAILHNPERQRRIRDITAASKPVTKISRHRRPPGYANYTPSFPVTRSRLVGNNTSAS